MRPRTTFVELKIPVGATLVFKDNQYITATVIDDWRGYIEIEGETTSVSKSAKEILNLNENSQINGNRYWMYEGETLYDRRKRMEQEGTYEIDLEDIPF